MQIFRFQGDDGKDYTGCEFDGTHARVIKGHLFSSLEKTPEKKAVQKILMLPRPPAIYCIGLNYRKHAEETGLDLPRYPVVFMKNPGCAVGHLDRIEIPACCSEVPEVDYEAELCVVIGEKTKNVTPENALAHVLGYTCANDISARRWQMHAGAGQWVKSKSFDTFCPFGPWIVTSDEIPDPNNLDIRCVLNDRVMQDSNTQDMIFSVPELIAYLSASATLLPGTLILTGTPSGVGYTRKPPIYLQPGDILKTEIENIGTLENTVAHES